MERRRLCVSAAGCIPQPEFALFHVLRVLEFDVDFQALLVANSYHASLLWYDVHKVPFLNFGIKELQRERTLEAQVVGIHQNVVVVPDEHLAA